MEESSPASEVSLRSTFVRFFAQHRLAIGRGEARGSIEGERVGGGREEGVMVIMEVEVGW